MSKKLVLSVLLLIPLLLAGCYATSGGGAGGYGAYGGSSADTATSPYGGHGG